MFESFLTLITSGVIAGICVILVLHPQYEDGLVGRLGLTLIALVAWARFLAVCDTMWHHEPVHVTSLWLSITLWAGLSIFLSRHLWRFLRWQRRGDYSWRKAEPK